MFTYHCGFLFQFVCTGHVERSTSAAIAGCLTTTACLAVGLATIWSRGFPDSSKQTFHNWRLSLEPSLTATQSPSTSRCAAGESTWTQYNHRQSTHTSSSYAILQLFCLSSGRIYRYRHLQYNIHFMVHGLVTVIAPVVRREAGLNSARDSTA